MFFSYYLIPFSVISEDYVIINTDHKKMTDLLMWIF